MLCMYVCVVVCMCEGRGLCIQKRASDPQKELQAVGRLLMGAENQIWICCRRSMHSELWDPVSSLLKFFGSWGEVMAYNSF